MDQEKLDEKTFLKKFGSKIGFKKNELKKTVWKDRKMWKREKKFAPCQLCHKPSGFLVLIFHK